MQVLGFTHIDYLPLCIEILIYARVLRDTLEERGNMLRLLIQNLHMDERVHFCPFLQQFTTV